jgi:hypothetical protein
MAIGSISGSGLEGINKGFGIVGAAADKIAKISGSEETAGDLASSAVDLQRGKIQVQASAKVLETEGVIIGSLIDISV